MASKKSQAVQLQVDVTTNDEWNKLLHKDGLIVVDIYSDWCGPCTAMAANLKKIKLEAGGDFLHLATAKANKINCLCRFINRSEPTWMILAGGQMLELLFGANAPVIQRTILKQLVYEKEVLEGTRTRITRSPQDYSEEEIKRNELHEQEEVERLRLIEEKLYKQLSDKKRAEAMDVLENMSHFGLLVIFPHAVRKGLDILENYWGGSCLNVSKKDRLLVKEEAIEDIQFFSSFKLKEKSIEFLLKDKVMALMMTHEDSEASIDDCVLKFVYGDIKEPPGCEESPAQALAIKQTIMKEIEDENGEVIQTEEIEIIDGLWAPSNELVKATALKYCFPLLTTPLIKPQNEATPPHILIAFDAFKRTDIFKLAESYQKEVMAYGFFTDDTPGNSKLIAKTNALFEKQIKDTTYQEKLVLKLSIATPEAFLAFETLGPTYCSNNIIDGEKECLAFFPENYNEKEKMSSMSKRSASKKKIKRIVEAAEHLVEQSVITTDTIDSSATREDEGDEIIFVEDILEGDHEERDELTENVSSSELLAELSIADGDIGVVDIDKATSPMEDMS